MEYLLKKFKINNYSLDKMLKYFFLIGALFINREVMVLGTIDILPLQMFSHAFQILLAVVMIFYCWKNNLKIEKKRISIFFVFFFCYMITMMLTKDFRFGYFTLSLTYLNCTLLLTIFSLTEFLDFFYKSLFFICCFSLVMYFIQSFFPQFLTLFPRIVNLAGNKFYFAGLTNMEASMDQGIIRHLQQGILIRNYGPFREPAVFQSFIIIALLYGLLRYKDKTLHRIIVLVLTLITTFSTTGYIAFIAVLLAIIFSDNCYILLKLKELVILFHKKIKKLILKSNMIDKVKAIMILLVFSLITITFLTVLIMIFSKVMEKFFSPSSIHSTLSRFAGFTINIKMMLNEPLWGNGILFADTNFVSLSEQMYGISLSNTNTLFSQGARFGIPLFIFLSSRYYLGIKNAFNSGRISCFFAFVAFLCIIFGSNLQYTILFVLPLFCIKSDAYNSKEIYDNENNINKKDTKKILYISSMFDYDTYEKLFVKDIKPLHAANKFHNLICHGLAINGMEVLAYSVLPINRECYDGLFVKSSTVNLDGYNIKYMNSFNIPLIRHLTLAIQSFIKVLTCPKDTVIVFDVLVVSASFGAVIGAILSKKRTIGIVTDLPQFMDISSSDWMLKMNNYLMSLSDGFIFLTKQMHKKINKKNRPFCIIEGLVDPSMSTKKRYSLRDRKKIIYAGSLMEKYGIRNLCDAFISCAKDNEELHIYGDGDFAEQIKKINHPRVFYHGNCLNKVVVEAELTASLLVNPRPIEGEYTKYSFPSKTLEYMASGTPVLTTKLPGIPEEYNSYLYYFDGTTEGLKEMLRYILDKDSQQLDEFGKRAKEFVIKKKNCTYQCKKIKALIDIL